MITQFSDFEKKSYLIPRSGEYLYSINFLTINVVGNVTTRIYFNLGEKCRVLKVFLNSASIENSKGETHTFSFDFMKKQFEDVDTHRKKIIEELL